MSNVEFDEQRLQLGYVAGAHGVGGAIRVKLFNPDSSAINVGVRVLLRADGHTRALEVARVARQAGSNILRLWLVGVDDRSAADALRSHELWIDRASLPELADDEYYLADLIGLAVERIVDGQLQSLGNITGVTSNTAQDLLCVRMRGREWLLPAIPPFVVAIESTRVLVDVHDDMLPDEPRGSA